MSTQFLVPTVVQVKLEQLSVKGIYIPLIWCDGGSKGNRASFVKIPSTSAVLPLAPLLSWSTQVVKNQIVQKYDWSCSPDAWVWKESDHVLRINWLMGLRRIVLVTILALTALLCFWHVQMQTVEFPFVVIHQGVAAALVIGVEYVAMSMSARTDFSYTSVLHTTDWGKHFNYSILYIMLM